MPEEKSKHGFIVKVRPYKTPNPLNEFVIEAKTGDKWTVIAGELFYIEHSDYLKIALINVRVPWRGKGCSDDMMAKLLEMAKGRVILTGQINAASYQMFLRMQKDGLLTLSPPRPKYYDETMWEVQSGK
jgi:hypothetical protein